MEILLGGTTQRHRAAASLPASGQKLAADNSASQSASAAPAVPGSDIEQLNQMLLDRQRQINEFQRHLVEQNKFGAPPATPVHQSLGAVSGISVAVPPSPPAALLPPRASESAATSPLQLKVGDAFITPVGSMDLSAVGRSTNPGSGIGTNFGSIPYRNLSTQNSRTGARVDAIVRNIKILGYWQSDFLGQLGNPPNGALAVTSNPYVFRMRLYRLEVTRGRFEFLAGQLWSLLTSNRKGISLLPGDISFSQDIDASYQSGLVWGRIPGFFGFHPSNTVAFGIGLENSEPYAGGANGGVSRIQARVKGATNLRGNVTPVAAQVDCETA